MKNSTHAPYLSEVVSNFEPRHFSAPAPWAGHLPFARWLIEVLMPKTFVELGAYSGISYLGFCQAVQELQLPTRCYAVDTWQGDAHAGAYGESIYQSFRQAHDAHYSAFSKPLRMSFDEATAQFQAQSIDLLHIDGLHTYEAVKHDFETWHHKCSDRAVVLFHDTDVYRDDFGVYRFWDEVKAQYPSFRFHHSNGLGVLLLGSLRSPELLALAENPLELARAQQYFSRLGRSFERQDALLISRNQHEAAQNQLQNEQQGSQRRHEYILAQDAHTLALQRELAQAKAHGENWVIEATRAQERLTQTQEQLAQKQQSLDEHVAQLLAQSSAHTIELEEKSKQLGQQEKELIESRELIAQKEQANNALREQSEARHAWLVQQDNRILQLEQKQSEIYRSRSWRITQPLRAATDFARQAGLAKFLKRSRQVAQHGKNALAYLARGDFQGLRTRAQQFRQQKRMQVALAQVQQSLGTGTDRQALTVGILCTPHTLFVARGLLGVLSQLGIHANICSAEKTSAEYSLHIYIVICPQMFEVLPPGERRIFMQMEQGVSSRWFTGEYLQNMQNSLAVADYSIWNLGHLQTLGIAYAQTYLIPVCGIPEYEAAFAASQAISKTDKPVVLFYGDIQCERRQRLINALRKGLTDIAIVRVENNLFGEALHLALSQAEIIVNIHYYEGALLETTRLYECLSFGARIISEVGSDQSHHPHLNNCIEFVPVGDEAVLLEKCKELLSESTMRKQERLQQTLQELTRSQSHTRFLTARMLFGLGLLPWEKLLEHTRIEKNADQLVLSLPETPDRRNKFMRSMPEGFAFFDGLRMRPGWMGCAASYKYLCAQASATNTAQLTVMEDDAILPKHFLSSLGKIKNYLGEQQKQWHVFSGLIAVLPPETQILEVKLFEGTLFLTIDRMLSTVFNIYSPAGMQLLAGWDASNADPHSNTVDQYLRRQSMRVITTLPFFVGHDDELNSTLWGTNNSMYRPLLNSSEEKLRQLALDWCRLHSPERQDILQKLMELESTSHVTDKISVSA